MSEQIIPYNKFAPQIREIVQSSILENFMQEGRFGNGPWGGGNTKWEKSQRALKQGGQTLQDTGQLRASIRVNVKASGGLSLGSSGENISMRSTGEIIIEAGSNKPYAAIHQYGGTISLGSREGSAKWKASKSSSGKYKYKFAKNSAKGKNVIGRGFKVGARSITMPKRPYLVLQNEDIVKIQMKFLEFLSKQSK